MRLVQHKKEAYWFYRFLSVFYDNYVNPFFWTREMRNAALKLARFDRNDLRTIDIGSGTGFTTQGIVELVKPELVTCVDQSPHQMARARSKPDLQGCDFLLGDAEDIPFATDYFDRYVSAGSIEYWPEPQRGITEAYRVLKPGGIALIIGPLRPRNFLGRLLADLWMLFPEEQQYLEWFRKAGFEDIRTAYVAPQWVVREKYGIAIAGRKPQPGVSPLKLGEKKLESLEKPLPPGRKLLLAINLLIGSLAGFFFIPMALLAHFLSPLRRKLLGKNIPAKEPEQLTKHQKQALAILFILLLIIVLWIAT